MQDIQDKERSTDTVQSEREYKNKNPDRGRLSAPMQTSAVAHPVFYAMSTERPGVLIHKM
jgi:hypothetical protein